MHKVHHVVITLKLLSNCWTGILFPSFFFCFSIDADLVHWVRRTLVFYVVFVGKCVGKEKVSNNYIKYIIPLSRSCYNVLKKYRRE
jgi:hypothetical protein